MKENAVYVVEVASRSDVAALTVAVLAPSSAVAKAHVARTLITARRATSAELLRMRPEDVQSVEAAEPQATPPATQSTGTPVVLASEGAVTTLQVKDLATEPAHAATTFVVTGGLGDLPAFLRGDAMGAG